MIEPRCRITLDLSYDEYLSLLWYVEAAHGGPGRGIKLQKQTVRKLKAYDAEFFAAHRAARQKRRAA